MTGERSANEIGYHAVRAGDDPGQHSILFGMLGEKIELQVAPAIETVTRKALSQQPNS